MKQNYVYKLVLSLCIVLGISSNEAIAQLYPYSSHTFTACGATGRFGPTLANVQTAYDTEAWAANTAYLNMNSQGIQEWTVPVTGDYMIETWGAGSTNSTGAKISGEFMLTEGDVIYIAVGQNPSPNVAGGNGGTFVSTGASLLASIPLIVSGGGGGYSFINSPLGDAGFTNDGNNGNTGYGGIAGAGGQTNTNNTQYGGGGGGGFYSDGVNTSTYGFVGQGFINGAVGGDQTTNSADSEGGFGGGGAGYQYAEPAGGGGYSGGGGGGANLESDVEGIDQFGGAGGSFNNGNNAVNIGGNVGQGQVEITYFCDDLTPLVSANTVCDGEMVTLSATSTNLGVITWDNGITDNVAFTPSVGTTTYTALSSFISDCYLQVDVLVNALPTITALADTNNFCEGTTQVVLTGTGANTYTWDNSITDGLAFDALTGSTTYTVTGTDANLCENTATLDLIVNALPTVVATVDNALVCLGDDVVFTGTGASTYTWDNSVINNANYTTTLSGTTTYTVTGVDVNMCINMSTVDVTVNSLPTVSATVNNAIVCLGQDVILTGNGANTYTWDNGVTDGVDYTTIVDGTIMYTVTGTDLNLCENTGTVDVLINALPIVTGSSDNNNFCEGATQVVLTGAGANTYVWDNLVTDGVAFDATMGTTLYTVTGTDANVCENTATVNVVVNALPIVTGVTDNNNFCEGTTQVILTGAGANTYVWDNSVTDGIAFDAVTGTTTYTVTGTDVNMCVNTATVELIVNTLPVVIASVDTTIVCLGEDVVFTGSGATTYDWDNNVVDGTLYTTTVGGTITYTVTGIDMNMCENTASVDVLIHTLPTVIGMVDDSILCLGDTTVFKGVGAETYIWDNGVIDTLIYIPTTVGTITYTVIGTDLNMCENTANIDMTVNEVIINYTTADEIFGADGTIDLTVSGGVPVYTFDWDNDGTGDYDDLEDLSGLVTGTYIVTVLDSLGCEATETILLSSQVGIEESVQNLVSVYPNPTNENIYITTQGKFSYQITSINGTVIANGAGVDNEMISLDHVEAGIYFVNITINGNTNTIKVIKN
jgi:hypothetical protein